MKVLIFKPDEIGDFFLASGCIHLLARECGEGNLILVVKSGIAALAQREFPAARIIALPLRDRVRGMNKDAVNMYHCFPAWLRLCMTRVDAAICLRSMRDFIQTGLFLAPRAGRRVMCENLLVRSNRRKRRAVEAGVKQFFHPEIISYPKVGEELPAELEANRLVAAALLGREVSREEIMPQITSASWRGGDFWLLCPFSSSWEKDYDVARWATVLRGMKDWIPAGGIRLAGGPEQAVRLEEFATALRAAGIQNPVNAERSRPLERFPDLVAEAALVLTVDTAAAHIACAMGAPAVIVACGMHAGVYGPYSPNQRQTWLMADWSLGAKRWQESVTSDAVVSAIKNAVKPIAKTP